MADFVARASPPTIPVTMAVPARRAARPRDEKEASTDRTERKAEPAFPRKRTRTAVSAAMLSPVLLPLGALVRVEAADAALVRLLEPRLERDPRHRFPVVRREPELDY